MSDGISEFASETRSAENGDQLAPLRTVITSLRHRWWVVLGVFALVVAVAMWHTIQQPRLYRAQATVRIGEQLAPISGVPSGTAVRDFRVDPVQTEQQIIRSFAVGARVAERLGLRLSIVQPSRLKRSTLFGPDQPLVDSSVSSDEPFVILLGAASYALEQNGRTLATARYGSRVAAGGLTFTVPERPVVDENRVVLRVMPLGGAAGMVRGGIATRGLPQTNIVEISYTGTDPRTVRDVANTVAKVYDELSAEARRAQASKRAEFIRAQLDTQRVRLGEAQERLKAFKEREQLSNVGAEQTGLIQSIQQLERESETELVSQQIYKRLIGSLTAADTARDELKRLAGTEAIQRNPYISGLYENWFELLQKREELLTTRTEINPDVRAVNKLIDRTKADLRTASGLYLEGLQSKIESLRSRIGGLRQQLEKYPSLEAQESRLVADARTLQTIYDQLQSEFQRARISESSEDSGVRLIDEAAVPPAPISPNRRRILMTAMLLGALLGAGAAVTLERFDDSVKSPDEVRDVLGMTVLGTIPRIRVLNGASGDSSRLVTHEDPRSPVAEAYRSLRTNLAFARAHSALRVMVLTSPGPADGKSTTVANLAITFAQQGQRTLVIDADLRRAVLDNLFEVPRAPGLTYVLVGTASLQDVARATAIANLSVVGSGQFPPNPAELLGSAAMRRVLADAKENYDVVLLDSPPLLAVTDAAVLATMVDGAILVVRVGATAKTAVRRAKAQLQTVSAPVVGAVLNDVDFRQGSFGGTYGYYYYYYYGRDRGRNGGSEGLVGRVARWTARARSERS